MSRIIGTRYECDSGTVNLMGPMRAGDYVPSHPHNFAHVLAVVRGAADCEIRETLYGDQDVDAMLRAASQARGLELERRITELRKAEQWGEAEPLWLEWLALTKEPGKVTARATLDTAQPFAFIEVPAFRYHHLTAKRDDTVAMCLFGHCEPGGKPARFPTMWGPASG